MGRKPTSAEVRMRFFTARASGATLKQAVAGAGMSRTTGQVRADRLARVRETRPRPRPGTLAGHDRLRRYVEAQLALRWSPEQIAHRLVVDFPGGGPIVRRHGRSHLITLAERHSRYLIVQPIPDAISRAVVAALTRTFAALPVAVRRSVTWDRGIEMTRHQESTAATGVPVHFRPSTAPGSAALTRTPTGCASPSRGGPTSEPRPLSRCSRPSPRSTHDGAPPLAG
ncbi:DDE-type integrase/transposase/recombinase [uncultured Cellulomonas sp.]|uniref:DDE-type integrase/transposase/recombinase n=1 Tax=uncultured Cellulomonas sp. TaxID=189682 RepID=UPI00260BC05A|nr:DDE-type integrase/transposase/recombinase [uncultured Cellulomonas sp.]